MAATVAWYCFNGSSGSSTTTLVTSLNFGSTDAAEITPASYPIRSGENSYAKYVKAQFDGTFTQINNIKFYKSAGDYVTGESITFDGTAVVYATPVATDVGDGAVPTSAPGSPNVDIPGGSGVNGTITSNGVDGRTGFIRLQTKSTASTPSGPANQKTFTLVWDEQ